MLLNLRYIPIITKATRIRDHIVLLLLITSIQTLLKTFLLLVSVSPIFLIISLASVHVFLHLNFQCTYEKYYRDFSHFDKELFVADLEKIDFYSLANSMNNIIEVFQEITDKHAPKVTNATKRQFKKPWICNAILKSIKTKQKMFKTHFLSHDQAKVN